MFSLSNGFKRVLATAGVEQQLAFTEHIRRPIPVAPFSFTLVGRIASLEGQPITRDPRALLQNICDRMRNRGHNADPLVQDVVGARAAADPLPPRHLQYFAIENPLFPFMLSRTQFMVRHRVPVDAPGAPHYMIKDLNSTSGIWLDGNKLDAGVWVPLLDGVVMRFQPPSDAVREYLVTSRLIDSLNRHIDRVNPSRVQMGNALLPRTVHPNFIPRVGRVENSDLHLEYTFSERMDPVATARAIAVTGMQANALAALNVQPEEITDGERQRREALAEGAKIAARKGQMVRSAVSAVEWKEKDVKLATETLEKVTSRKRALDQEVEELSKKKARPVAEAEALDAAGIKAKMVEEFTCSMCTDLMDRTVMLDCGHCGCKECIETWFATNKANGKTCPECRSVHKGAPRPVRASDNMIALLVKQYLTPKEQQDRLDKVTKREMQERVAAQQTEARRLAQALGAQKKAARELEAANKHLAEISEN
jgi:hypothetical protein